MKTLNFEAVKVALKQDRTGYVLALSVHPDGIPEDLMRDFVGSRYQCVLVRVDGNEEPMNKAEEFSGDKAIRIAGMLSRDPDFWKYLYVKEEIFDEEADQAVEWVRATLHIQSRSELKTNREAQIRLDKIHRDYQEWKQEN